MNHIWLQVKDEDGEDNGESDNITWSEEKIHDTDIRYIKDKRHKVSK